MKLKHDIRKVRIIKRIIRHSEVYDYNYLSSRSVEELQKLQKDSLIELKIRMQFNSRRNGSKN